jgi:hypothetical protein
MTLYQVFIRSKMREVEGGSTSGDPGGIDESINVSHPAGHFYSPVIDPGSLIERQEKIWAHETFTPAIKFNQRFHNFVLSVLFPRYFPLFEYPASPSAGDHDESFYLDNSQFGWLDAPALFVLLNYWQPKRMIEVGSGFSSLLTADVNQRFLNGTLEFSCIEPFPREFLTSGIPGISEVIVQKVEDVPVSYFSSLGKNDILFIDSSHVSKTGSDVNYLIFEILPILKPGVIIHFHDIFLPDEYPKHWVLGEQRSWNEQYLVRALLMNSDSYHIQFGCSYARGVMSEVLDKALNTDPGKSYGGSSLWLRKENPNSHANTVRDIMTYGLRSRISRVFS